MIELLFLGVDSGGTSTIAALVDERKRLRGVGKAGSGNYHSAGVETARDNLIKAIESAHSEGGGGLPLPDCGVFGMGGLDSKTDREVIEDFVESTKTANKYLVVNDVVITYYAATLGSSGIAVVAGTGSIAYGSDGERESGLVGGWGWVAGDEGSAFYIARRALQEAAKFYDGRGRRTSLLQMAADFLGVDDFRESIPKLYLELEDPKQISEFSEQVTKAAEEGDSVAQEILKESSLELAEAAKTAAESLNLSGNFIVGCAGGVFRSEAVFREFEKKMRSIYPEAKVRGPIFLPVVGAIAMGLDQEGIKLNRDETLKLEEEIESRL